MRKVEFQLTATNNLLSVRVDGKLVIGAALDLGAIKAAKKAKQWNLALQEAYMKRIETRIRDAGLREDEVTTILSKFKQELNQA